MVCSFAFMACVIAQSSTPSPRCSLPNSEAEVVNAAAPIYPDEARRLRVGPATVLLVVSVKPDGVPGDVTVYRSSGDAAIDRQAMRAAHESDYVPKLFNCQPVSGTVLFRAQFLPDSMLQTLTSVRFSPPAGWSRIPNPFSAPGFRAIGEWTQTGRNVGVSVTAIDSPLAKYVSRRIEYLKATRAELVSSESVPLCNRGEAWKLAYKQGATNHVEVFQVVDDRFYEAYFFSNYGLPDDTVISSMESLCGS